MDRFLGMDSPLMHGLGKIADIVWLNILTTICCIPIVTAGAALTAQHYVVLKMVRNEEGYVTRSFFKSFKENFRQATIIWLIELAFIALFAIDLYIFMYAKMDFPKILMIIVCVVMVFVAMVSIYVFPVLARFDNSVKNTIKNAFMISILSLPKTVLMLIIYASPIIFVMASLRLVPIAALFGLSGTAYLCAMLYSGVFRKFEPEEKQTEDEDFQVVEEWNEETETNKKMEETKEEE